MRWPRYIFLIVLLFQVHCVYAQTCLPVEGLSFEKISISKLLVIKDGKNFATIDTYDGIPDKISNFRFFSEKLCTCSCPERNFHIDGKLHSVSKIEFFSK